MLCGAVASEASATVQERCVIRQSFALRRARRYGGECREGLSWAFAYGGTVSDRSARRRAPRCESLRNTSARHPGAAYSHAIPNATPDGASRCGTQACDIAQDTSLKERLRNSVSAFLVRVTLRRFVAILGVRFARLPACLVRTRSGARRKPDGVRFGVAAIGPAGALDNHRSGRGLRSTMREPDAR